MNNKLPVKARLLMRVIRKNKPSADRTSPLAAIVSFDTVSTLVEVETILAKLGVVSRETRTAHDIYW